MKKFLSVLAVLGIMTAVGTQSANAFSWSNMNPFNWGRKCGCEQPKKNCGCPVKKECPCTTGAAAPCDPCAKKTPCISPNREVTQPTPCDACDRLQQQMAK